MDFVRKEIILKEDEIKNLYIVDKLLFELSEKYNLDRDDLNVHFINYLYLLYKWKEIINYDEIRKGTIYFKDFIKNAYESKNK